MASRLAGWRSRLLAAVAVPVAAAGMIMVAPSATAAGEPPTVVALARNHYLVQYACGSTKVPSYVMWDNDNQLRAGIVPDPGSSCSSHLTAARSFVEMDLSGVAGKHVLSASLNLAVTYSTSCSASNYVFATGAVNPGLRFGAGPATGSLLGAVNGCPTTASVDLAGAVADAVASGASTFTFGVLSPNENDVSTWKRYSTNVGVYVTYS
jgi:hypothetical protein